MNNSDNSAQNATSAQKSDAGSGTFYRPRRGFPVGIILLALLYIAAILAVAPVLFGWFSPISAKTMTVREGECGTWDVVAHMQTDSWPGHDAGIVAISANDVWATGTNDTAYYSWQPLLYHWDGTSWTRISLEKPISGEDSLQVHDIVATSTNDVWVVGNTMNSTYISRPFALHWDGAQWEATLKFPGLGDNSGLYSAVAISPDDVWAMSDSSHISHWDGSQWSSVSPSYALDRAGLRLWEVIGLGRDTVWTVKADGLQSGPTLNIPWAGEISDRLLRMGDQAYSYAPSAISALRHDDIWAVGNYKVNDYNLQGGIVHWDGKTWKMVPSLFVGGYGELHDIKAISPSDVWAVGEERGRALVLHWDGAKWERVPGPEIIDIQRLRGIAVAGQNEIWVVGNAMRSCEDCYVGHLMTARFTRTPCNQP
ncbi:MAG TPA: hypothetical protein VJ183_09095 [Chloroflexia bacterium]|nr:hypothetical protein [Chloroflexia bacterium]